MFQAFVLSGGDSLPLAHTLATLVPAAVLGHLGRVAVHAPGAADEIVTLAEAAGCDLLLDDDPAAALAGFRRPEGWTLICRAGQILPDGWSDLAMRHASLAGRSGRAAVIGPRGGLGRTASAGLAWALGRMSSGDHVLLLPPAGRISASAGRIRLHGGADRLRLGYD